MKKTFLFASVLLIPVLVLTGCSNVDSGQTQGSVQEQEEETMAMDAGHGHGSSGAVLAGDRVAMKTTNLDIGDVEIAFQLFDESDNELTDDGLNVTHEKKLHLLVVRNDVTAFQHLHPEYVDGYWISQTQFTEQGEYHLYMDFDAVDGGAMTLREPVEIGGPTIDEEIPTVSSDMVTTVNNVTGSLVFEGEITTGEHLRATFSFTQNDEAVETIEPYLGAYGHVVILSHADPNAFIHAHPLTERAPTDGSVAFETEFSESGIYTVFGQFVIDGEILTFPFTISVVDGGTVLADDDHHDGEDVEPHGHENDTEPHDDTGLPPHRHN